MDTEVWKSIPSARGYYASNHGRIMSRRKKSNRIMNPMKNHNGHLYIFVDRKKRWVHHLVLEAFGFNRPSGFQCRHLDGNPENNRVGNLKWGTHQENVNDRWLHGTMPLPQNAPDTKLKPSDIPEIIKLASIGYSSRRIGGIYNTSHTTIQKVIRRERWKGYEQTGER